MESQEGHIFPDFRPNVRVLGFCLNGSFTVVVINQDPSRISVTALRHALHRRDQVGSRKASLNSGLFRHLPFA